VYDLKTVLPSRLVRPIFHAWIPKGILTTFVQTLREVWLFPTVSTG